MFLLLFGCNTVKIDPSTGLFPVFGAFSFPTWKTNAFVMENGSIDQFEAETNHAVSLTTATFDCMRAQSWQQSWNNASKDLLDASDQGRNEKAFCAGMPEFLDKMTMANRAYPPQKQQINFQFCIEGSDSFCGGDVPAEKFRTDDERLVWSRFYRDPSMEDLELADYWDTENCTMDFDRMDADFQELGVEGYQIDGVVTINKGNGQILAGSWAGKLRLEGGEFDGASTSGDFVTSVCHVPHADNLVEY